MMSWSEIFKNSRYAFLAALIARPAGLLLFSIWIAHRWTITDIALFESFSIFQFLVFFSWLPAWGTVTLMQTSREEEPSQKSFLFSNIFFGWLVLSVFYCILSGFWPALLPGMSMESGWVTLYILFSFYYFLQVYIYKNYLEENTAIQWGLSFAFLLSWILFGLLAKNFETFLRYQVIVQALFLVILKRGKMQGLSFQKEFWKQVLVNSMYTVTGGLGPILAAYFVQARFGLGNELNWFRYGTRELPILPSWLSGFGQSHLRSKLEHGIRFEELKQGVSKQISIIIIPLTVLIIFSKPLFDFLFGIHFLKAAELMSIYLLIYIPRMIFSQVVLQSKEKSTVLLYIGLIELAAMVIAAWIFMPTYGLEALVWILVGGTCLEKIIHIVYLKTKQGVNPEAYLPIKYFIVLLFCLLAAYWIKM